MTSVSRTRGAMWQQKQRYAQHTIAGVRFRRILGRTVPILHLYAVQQRLACASVLASSFLFDAVSRESNEGQDNATTIEQKSKSKHSKEQLQKKHRSEQRRRVREFIQKVVNVSDRTGT